MIKYWHLVSNYEIRTFVLSIWLLHIAPVSTEPGSEDGWWLARASRC